MSVPTGAVNKVARWCEEQTPAEHREQSRLEAETRGNKITIYECSRMPDVDWLRVPSAQLRYDDDTQGWSLYWITSDDKWHIVQVTPTVEIKELLDEIERDPDCLFFG